jgi:hypothetical protein
MRNGTLVLLLSGLVSAALAGVASAQVDRPAAALAASLPTAATVADQPELTELHVRWQVGVGAPDSLVLRAELVPVNAFEVAARGAVRGPLIRERAPDWSEEHLVVIAVDASGRETSWQKVLDPRVLRSEQPGPTGELQGEIFLRTETELVVVVPDETTASLHVYETRWDGGRFVLRLLGRFGVATP